jgi:hypothetical protein
VRARVLLAVGAVLLGRRDEEIPRRRLLALFRPAPEGASVRWYRAGHSLDARATRDFETWIGQRLGLTSVR